MARHTSCIVVSLFLPAVANSVTLCTAFDWFDLHSSFRATVQLVVSNMDGGTRRRTAPGPTTSVAVSSSSSTTTSSRSKHVIQPAFDPEVLGGDTCDLGECCMNPCGFFLKKLLHGQRSFQIAYIMSCYGGWAVILGVVYPLITQSTTVPSYHKTVGYAVLAVCLLSWRLASQSPGTITSASLAHYDNYAYDGILYQDNTVCPTLQIRKLARSKYDRYTRTHVPRFDHHCLFLNQSIGEDNYRFFLAFVGVHASMCAYAAVIVARLLVGGRQTVVSSSLVSKVDENRMPWLSQVTAACGDSPYLVVFFGLLVGVAAVLSGFGLFHMYLIAQGMTTNEYYKWKAMARHTAVVEGQSTTTTHEDPPQQDAPVRPKDEESAVRSTSTLRGRRMPRNAYNRGLASNFYEVLYPRSQRQVKEPQYRL
jgi:hypothetical protein